MSENDDNTSRRKIRELLIKHGFGWVVEQAETQISVGKPSSKQISEQEFVSVAEDPLFTVRTPRRRRASLITSEPYSESEKLDIFLQAIEAAIKQRADLEKFILDQFRNFSEIRFEPDVRGEDADIDYLGKAHSLDRTRANQELNLVLELVLY